MATTLTPRQREVLDLFLSGLTYKEVAARCKISPETVNPHLRTIAKKIGASGIARETLRAAVESEKSASARTPLPSR